MYFLNRFRYVVLLMSIVCLTMIFSNCLAFNFTVICMDDILIDQISDINNNTTESLLSSSPSTSSHWLKSSSHINALFSAIAIGGIIGTLPSTYIIQKIGVCGTLTSYGAISTIATLAFPMAVRSGFVCVFIIRVMQGLATALSFPATGLIPSQWSTTKATGTFIAILSCHVQFSSIITMPLAGELCESSLGWPAVFYFQGTFSAIAFTMFFFFYKDDPGMHRNVSVHEFTKISEGKCGQKKQSVPYRAIATDRCIVGIWLSTIGGNLGFQVFLLYGPTYINKVLHFDIKSTGFATALPHILSTIMKFAVGPISDRARCISDRWRLIIFAAFSQGAMAMGFLSLALITSPIAAQVVYTLSIVFSGVNVVGTIKCAQMVARQHVHAVMAVISFILCIIVLLVPIAVFVVCPDNTPQQWSRLFIGISVIVIIANIPFLFVARSEPAPWTSDKVHALPDKIDTITINDIDRVQNS